MKRFLSISLIASVGLTVFLILGKRPRDTEDTASKSVPTPVAQDKSQPKEVITNALAAVVEVIASTEGKPSKSGTGFGLSADGLIATNAHLVTRASTISVRTLSGAEYRVKKVLRQDSSTDVALIQLDAKNIPHLKLSTSEIKTGLTVMVVGNPQGLNGSASEGIVSAVRRGKTEQETRIQITAPISSGSSGSPVLDLHGEVIAMVSSKLVDGDALGFAIPSSIIANAIDSSKDLGTNDDTSLFGNFMYSFKPDHSKDPVMQQVEKVYRGDSHALAIDAMLTASKSHPDCIPLKLLLAERYQASGDSISATRLYQEIIRLHPENRKAPLGLVDGIYSSSDKWPAARTILEEAIRRDPLNFRARLELAKKLSSIDYLEKLSQAREAALIAPFHLASVEEHLFAEALYALKSRDHRVDDDVTRNPSSYLKKFTAYTSMLEVAVEAGVVAVEGKPDKAGELMSLLQKENSRVFPLVDDAIMTLVLIATTSGSDTSTFDDVVKVITPLREKNPGVMTVWQKDWSYPLWTVYPRLHAEILNEIYYDCGTWRFSRNDPLDLFAAAAIPDLKKMGRHAGDMNTSENEQADCIIAFIQSYQKLIRLKAKAVKYWAQSRNLGTNMDPPRSPLFELWIQMWCKAFLAKPEQPEDLRSKLTAHMAEMPAASDSVHFAAQTKNYSTGKNDETKFFEHGALGDISVEAALTWAWITAKEDCVPTDTASHGSK